MEKDVAKAIVDSEEFGEQIIYISSEKGARKRRTNSKTGNEAFVLGYEKPLADAIFKAAANNTLPIDFHTDYHHTKIRHTLISYSYSKDERFYNKYRKNHVKYREKVALLSEIYIYEQHCRCFSCFDKYGFESIENICGIVPLEKDREKTVEIDMQKCKHCGKIFIDGKSLSIYENRYGELALTKKELDYWIDNDDECEYEYAPDSILSRNGYNTSLPTTQRWDILSSMIERGVSKAEIKDLFCYLISTRGKRCHYALPKWQMDLEYVNNYEIGLQEKIYLY